MKRPRRAYLLGGGALLLTILIVMLFAPQLTRVSPDYWDTKPSILMGLPPFSPEPDHLLGTDQFGRDIWSRVVYGTRWSMLFAFLITAGRLTLALPAALLSAFGPRRIGWLIDRCYVISNAIPPLLIYILVLSAPRLRLVGLWPSVIMTVLLLALIEWPRLAVVVKGRLEGLLAEPFVEGAIAAGCTRWQLFKNHLFPHLWPVLLQLMSAEMARALVAIAQMAVFGIMIGGGVVNRIGYNRPGNQYVLTTGIPEWGSLLADGRGYTLTKPWIPLVPASAFLIGVTGFTLFAQGLETLLVSVQTMKDATTARLSRRWRWSLALVVAGALLWYFQGLPWNREAGIVSLAARQAGALTAHDAGAFAATIAPQAWGPDQDLGRWAAQLASTRYERVSITPQSIEIRGSRASAAWQVEVTYRDQRPSLYILPMNLVRRFGNWYATGEPYHVLRGYHTDVVAKFDPVDPRAAAIPVRWQVQYVANAADHAFEAVGPLFAEQAGAPRPLLKLYASQADYEKATGQPGAGQVSYTPGESIRVSPHLLIDTNRWDIERSIAYALIECLTETRLGRDRADPLAIGAYELSVDSELETYRIDVERLAGQPLLTLPELYAARLDQLPQAQTFAYAIQSALLTEFARSRLHGQVTAAAGPAELAAHLGMTERELAAQYWSYMLERIASESLLTVPAAKVRVPAGLPEAITGRAAAVTAGDDAAFLGSARPLDQPGHAAWLASARAAGLVAYRATLLDLQESGAQADVLVLEELTFRDGHAVAGVVRQTWSQLPGNVWAACRVAGPVP